MSHAYLSRIESDEREPSLRAMRVIADALGVSAHYLETGKHPQTSQSVALRDASRTLNAVLASLDIAEQHLADLRVKLDTVATELGATEALPLKHPGS